jgi:hypothetical protein
MRGAKMKITLSFLKSKGACQEGVDWFLAQKEKELIPILRKLEKENRWPWANWLIVRCMNYKQYVSYAVFAAEQVINIYEKKYPEDKRPRKAIDVAKKCIENPTKENKKASASAASATYATYAAASADAAYAAAAAASATYATDAAYAAAASATYATDAAYAAAAAAAYAAIETKILNYGISLLEEL